METGCSTSIRSLVMAAVFGLTVGAGMLPASAGAANIITFSSFENAIPATLTTPEIAPRGAGRGQALPSAWGWNYTGNPADTQYAVYGSSTSYVNNIICIGGAGACASNTPAGGAYQGYEFLHFRFDLPANATNVALNMITQNADDRHVLLVNGTSLGGFNGNTTIQNMKDGSGLHPVTFSPNVPVTFSDPALFDIGQPNHLTFWINNTFRGIVGDAIAHQGSGDPSALYVAGWISYDAATTVVPVPPAGLLMLAGVWLLGWTARRRG